MHLEDPETVTGAGHHLCPTVSLGEFGDLADGHWFATVGAFDGGETEFKTREVVVAAVVGLAAVLDCQL